MKFKNPWVSATKRLLTKEAEHALYEKAANDIELNNIHKGIWTKAFSLTEGDDKKQKAKYIELMVEHYKDLILPGEELEDILTSEKEKKKKAEAEEKEERNKAKAVRDEKRKKAEAAADLEKKKKQREEERKKKIAADREKQKKWIQSAEGKKSRLQEKIVLIAFTVITLSLILTLPKNELPKNLKYKTYQCSSYGNLEIVYIDDMNELIHNTRTGKNAYKRSSNEDFEVYILWNSTYEGYMFNKNTNELGQLLPQELCKFDGYKSHTKTSN